jgi:Rieske 2Fe-2S protein
LEAGVTTNPKPSRLDPEPTPRRDFLGFSAMAAAGAALLFGLLGMLRLPKAAVLPSLSKKFKVTHLGCIVKPTPKGFECPCHGSRFGPDGAVTRGPAPKALPWLGVTVASGSVTVDEDKTVPIGAKKEFVA